MHGLHLNYYLPVVTGFIKLALDGGKASPAPPVGPALGSKVTPLCPPLPPLRSCKYESITAIPLRDLCLFAPSFDLLVPVHLVCITAIVVQS